MTTTFRYEHSKLGSTCSGSEGPNRTYTLAYSGYVLGTMSLHKQGAYLYEGQDYTVSGVTVTFIVSVYNDEYLNFDYYSATSGTTSQGSPTYATTVQLADVLGIKGVVPSRQQGSTTMSNEQVTSGTPATTTTYYLQQYNVLAGTYTLYTGGTTAATATTTLTETTHYVLDKTNGGITFTAAGVTAISTNYVFATYAYVKFNLTDSQLSDTLLRCQKEIDNDLQTTYTDGTATNPSYPSNVEYWSSTGRYDRNYFSVFRPVANISSALASSITSSATTLTVTAGTGASFPTSGSIVIENEVLTYTGVSTDTLTGLTRGANGSTAAAHASAKTVQTSIMEVSSTYEGTTPTWTALNPDKEMDIVGDLGKWYIFDNQIIGGIYVQDLIHVRPDVPHRVRLTYLYGGTTIPADITRLCLLLSKRALVNDNVLGSAFKGRSEFNPQFLTADNSEIDMIMNNNRRGLFGNT